MHAQAESRGGVMRGLQVRAAEWQPIAQLMESGEYDTPESLAKAVLKHCYDTFLLRDFYLTVVDVDGINIAYGLSATESAAKRVQLGGGHRRMILPVASAEGHIARMVALEGVQP